VGLLHTIFREIDTNKVYGPPASGKTTLMHLLHARIMSEYPDAQVYIYEHWPIEELERINSHTRIKRYFPGSRYFQDGQRRYFLFDEGQTSYWDKCLWLMFKDGIQGIPNNAFMVNFCRTKWEWAPRGIYDPVPLAFGMSVTLDRIQYNFYKGDSKPFGLLLDREECYDLIGRQRPKLLLAEDLQDFIYELTGGHVGCIRCVLDFLVLQVTSVGLS
jgi:hypothetical protein